MKHQLLIAFAFIALSIQPSLAETAEKTELSEARKQLQSQERFQNAQHPEPYKLHQGSDAVGSQEYVIVDLTGSITRSPCPYTCEDRGLSKNNCRAWKSVQDPQECYVRNTSIPSDAFPELKTQGGEQGGQQLSRRGEVEENTRGRYTNERSQGQR